jgi:ribosome-associated translation inhibitor RaiA
VDSYGAEFEFEFLSEIEQRDEELRAEAEIRLRDLAEGHTDLVGASVALEELSGETTPHAYQARVVVYKRPENIVAVEKQESAIAAIRRALDAVERQVREERERRAEPWKQP